MAKIFIFIRKLFLKLVMPVIGKRNIGGANNTSSSFDFKLSKAEIIFIVTKLQDSTFKGRELESYQQVLIKLKAMIDES